MIKRSVLRASVAAMATALAVTIAPALQATEMVLPSEVTATHWKTNYMNEFAETVKKRTNGAPGSSCSSQTCSCLCLACS